MRAARLLNDAQTWDPARAAEALALADAGMPYSMVAAHLGVTRNAIAGVVYRQRAAERDRQRRAAVAAIDAEIVWNNSPRSVLAGWSLSSERNAV